MHSQPRSLIGIAEVGELPVEYGSQSVGADDHIAIAEVAVHERVRRGICVHALAQPAKGELENRPRLAEKAVCLVHVGNLARRGLAGQHGQQRYIHAMDARKNAADLKGELRADRRERFAPDDPMAEPFTLDVFHQEAAPDAVSGSKHVNDMRRWNACRLHHPHQLSSDLEIDFVGIGGTGRLPAEDQPPTQAWPDSLKSPNLLTGAARKASQVGYMVDALQRGAHNLLDMGSENPVQVPRALVIHVCRLQRGHIIPSKSGKSFELSCLWRTAREFLAAAEYHCVEMTST